MKKIYLAGPDVFAPNPKEIGRHKLAACARLGLEGMYPMDTLELDLTQPKTTQGMFIFDIMEQAMNDADAIVVNLTPYHGPSMDVGSAVEVGYLRALRKPLFAYSNTTQLFADRVVDYWNGEITQRETGERQGPDGMSLEEFDMYDNLMIHGSVLRSTGIFVMRDVPVDQRYSDLSAFDECLAKAAKWLSEHDV